MKILSLVNTVLCVFIFGAFVYAADWTAAIGWLAASGGWALSYVLIVGIENYERR